MLVSGSFLSNEISPSVAIKSLDKIGIDYLHVDVMDGKFVSQKGLTIKEVIDLSKYTTKKLDIHLMVKNPIKYIEEFSLLNIEYITFHYEAVKNHIEIINLIKNYGIKAGIAIKPSTSVNDIGSLLELVDLVLVMSVEPGKSGQKFIESVVYKMDVLKRLKDEKNYKYIINVDGGINEETFEKVKPYVDMVVSASYLLSGNGIEKVKRFKM